MRALGLCDQATLTGRFPADTPLPESPAECVRQLVSGGVCTRYQGKMLLAGKGHETGQVIGSGENQRVLPFDDALVARECAA